MQKIIIKYFFSLLIILNTLSIAPAKAMLEQDAAISPLCIKDSIFTETLPVQTGGRVKPFYVMARENMKFLWGKQKQDPLVMFCNLLLLKKAPDRS